MNVVNRLFWLNVFMLLIGFCFTACSDNDDERNISDNPVKDIVGSWKYSRQFGYNEGKEYSEQRSGNQVWVFYADGTLTYADRDGDINHAKWSIEDKILTVGGFDYIIEILTKKRMVISEGEEGWNIEKREYIRVSE